MGSRNKAVVQSRTTLDHDNLGWVISISQQYGVTRGRLINYAISYARQHIAKLDLYRFGQAQRAVRKHLAELRRGARGARRKFASSKRPQKAIASPAAPPSVPPSAIQERMLSVQDRLKGAFRRLPPTSGVAGGGMEEVEDER